MVVFPKIQVNVYCLRILPILPAKLKTRAAIKADVFVLI